VLISTGRPQDVDLPSRDLGVNDVAGSDVHDRESHRWRSRACSIGNACWLS
jgi:hypothetical protein